MSEHFFRERQVERHKEDGPVNCMESENVLADDVQVRGPVFAEVFTLFVNIVTQRRDIVRQRVKPNVNNVLFVKRRDPEAPV